MLPGSLISGDVNVFASRVTVNGVDRPAVSISLDAGMRSDLPSQISRSGSSMSRTGTVEWATDEDVSERPVTAFRDWGVWRPQKGDTIVVYAGDGVHEWPRFTGLVDETTGDVGSGMRSTITVDIDRLSGDFSCEPMLWRMPPLEGTTAWRFGGISPMYFMDAALRAGGYHVTPPTMTTHVLNVPYQNSLFPSVDSGGELLSASGMGDQEWHSNWATQPWGLSVSGFTAVYSPRYSSPASDPVHISLMVAEAHHESANVSVRYGSNDFRLIVSSNRRVAIQRVAGGTATEVCFLSASQMTSATRVEALLKGGVATLRNKKGASSSGSFASLGSSSLSRIVVNAWPGARIAGLQVSHPASWQEFQHLYHEPSARLMITPGSLTTWGTINHSPRYRQRSAISMVEDLADQTLSAVWFDEHCVLHVAPSNGLRGRPVSQTITTADDVLSFAWSDRLLASASRVTVTYDHPVMKATDTRRTLEVYRGSKQQLESRSVIEDVISPPADVDWYGVDEHPVTLPGAGWQNYNRGEGSFVGVTYTSGRDPVENQGAYTTTVDFTKSGINEYIVTHTVGNLPGDVVAETTSHPTTTFLWERNRDEPLPVLRAWALVEWVERETTAQTTRPGPLLRVDLQAQAIRETAQSVRDYLVGLIENAHPQITGLGVTPDPRRQLGDVILLESENYLGVTLRCLITEMNETLSPDGYEQSLSLEVISVSTGSLTYEEWEQAFPGTLTYAQWRNRRDATDTYQDFNSDPLKGAN